MRAWHDYFTDHGGDEGRPEIEEEIDEAHVAWSRARIHDAIDAEATLLGGNHARVAVGGASQGCCMALDAALTHPALLGGVFASFGQVYACTARALAAAPGGAAAKRSLQLVAFHGAADRCIAASLAMRRYADLIDLGFSALRLHVEPDLGHCEASDVESDLLCDALASWGFVPREGEPEPEEEPGEFYANMWDDYGGDAHDDDAPDGTYQHVYWTDGLLIERTKYNGVWKYNTSSE